jgi:hypothetical protein
LPVKDKYCLARLALKNLLEREETTASRCDLDSIAKDDLVKTTNISKVKIANLKFAKRLVISGY